MSRLMITLSLPSLFLARVSYILCLLFRSSALRISASLLSSAQMVAECTRCSLVSLVASDGCGSEASDADPAVREVKSKQALRVAKRLRRGD